MSFGARALIRLDALQHNFQTIRTKVPGAPVMAVVKANAYGHGIIDVARHLPDADSFAVARLNEADALRESGIAQPLVLLSGANDPEDLIAAIERGYEVVVHCGEQLGLLESQGGGAATVWLKIDTGMRRLGFRVAEAAAAIDRLRDCRAVREVRLMSHLANAEDRDDDMTRRQIDAFAGVAGEFDGPVSLANSAAIFAWADSLRSIAEGRTAGTIWIRPGIALYGISPFPGGCGADLGLRPVMELQSRLIAVKPISSGDRVGYGGTWRARRDTTLGLISAGYGDGYSRFLPSGTPVFVNGRRVPLAGVVSMDIAAVDLGAGAVDRVGDGVTLWGDELPVEEIARSAGTIPYQLVCGVTNREPSSLVA